MKFKRLAIRFAVAAIAIVSIGMSNEAFAGGIGGGSWGGSVGFSSRGYAGGSWGSARAFRTPVRNFFAYRQPVRRLVRGVTGFGSRGWGSTGYGSYGGSGGYQYYSSGTVYGSTGYGGSTGYSYASTGSSAAFHYAPVSTYPSTTYPTVGTVCNDCVGQVAIPAGSIPALGNSTGVPLSDGTIIGNQDVVPAEEYYDSGAGAAESSQGSGVRGFESPPTPQPENGDETTSIFDGRGDAVLQVDVPQGAQIYVNNRLTTTKGAQRKYVSKNLKHGKDYKFNVEAVVERNGGEVALSKEVVLRAGRRSMVSFDFEQPVLTQLTVKVPENAKIELCGNETAAKGKIRNFRTRLKPGQTWENYNVTVQIEENGKIVEKKKSLTITAGQKYVVDFSDTRDYLVKK